MKSIESRMIQVLAVIAMLVFVLVSASLMEVEVPVLTVTKYPIPVPVAEEVETPVVVSSERVKEVKELKQEYHTYIDREYIGYAEEISEMYNVCPELIFAMIEHESSGNPKAENSGCYGLMQISERWHKDRMKRLGVTDLFDPYGNILVGVDYIAELADTYGDLEMVLMVYNGSSDAQERWENNTPTEYAKSIMSRSVELERLHGKEQ